MVRNPTRIHVEMPIEENMTMAIDNDDPTPFTPVTPSQPHKKVKPNPSEVNKVQHVHETDLRITFSHDGHNGHSSSKFNVATYTKNLLSAMLHHDDTIAITTADSVFYLAHDKFPNDEEQFRKYFHVHAPAKHQKHRNKTVIGCVILSNRTIQEIKKAYTDAHDMMKWLQKHHVYLEADSLGTTKICTVGYLFNIHPRISHHTALKKHIYNELEQVSITVEEAQTLSKHAKEHHKDNFNETYIPPFELYITSAGAGNGNNRVSTETIGVKSNIEHAALLKEMLIRTTKNSVNNKPVLKFIPNGIALNIGNDTYTALICKQNQYLSSVTTIPVVGFTEETLALQLDVYDPTTKTKKKSIRNIMLDTPWCHAIEPTKYVGKFLLVTTRAHLAEGRQWLDANLKPMFENYVNKHPNFKPDADYPIAQRGDYKPQTATMDSYAEALKRDTIATNMPTNSEVNKRFKKPPKTHRTRQLDFDIDPQEFPILQHTTNASNNTNLNTSASQNTNNDTQISSQTNTVVNSSEATANTIDIVAIQQNIIQTIRGEINQHIQQQIRQEMTTFKADMLSITNKLTKKQDQTNFNMEQMQAQLATLINIMSPPTNGGGMK